MLSTFHSPLFSRQHILHKENWRHQIEISSPLRLQVPSLPIPAPACFFVIPSITTKEALIIPSTASHTVPEAFTMGLAFPQGHEHLLKG